MVHAYLPRLSLLPGLIIAVMTLLHPAPASARGASGYPAAVVARPLVLPASLIELGAELTFPWEDPVDPLDLVGLGLNAKAGTSFGEFSADAVLLIKNEGLETFHRFHAGMMGRITQSVALTIDSTILAPTGAVTLWGNSVGIALRGRLGPRVALRGDVGLLLVWALRDNVEDDFYVHATFAGGPELQLTSNVGLALMADLGLAVADTQDAGGPDNSVGIRLQSTYAFSGAFDVFARLRIANDYTGLMLDNEFAVGLRGRL